MIAYAQTNLFAPLATRYALTTDPQIDALLRGGAPVALGISGGKDSSADASAPARRRTSSGRWPGWG